MAGYDELHDLTAERMFLGAVWHSAGRVLDDTLIVAEDFWHQPHRHLLRAFTKMRASGAPFDASGVRAAVAAADLAQVLGSLPEVVTSGAVPQSAGWHANVLIRLAAHRRVVEAAVRVTQVADGEREPDELAEFVRSEIDTAVALRDAVPAESWEDHLAQALTRWVSPVQDAIPTGWHDLDELLSGGGLRPGHLTVVGARPGVGKSLVGTMLAGRTAAAGHGVYFASAEMSSAELVDRIAAAYTGVDLKDLTNRTLNEGQLGQLQRAIDRIGRWPLRLDDQVSTVADIRRGARTTTRQPAGLGLVIVDYLQLLDAPNPGGRTPRHEQVAAMSRSMKLLAREFNVPVVLLSQLNRGSTQRADKQPLISDLRESGAVEQDADEIVLLHRDEEDANLAGQIQLHLAKNRHGPTGTVLLRWQPYISRITNPSNVGSAA